jgi:DNA polymerase IV
VVVRSILHLNVVNFHVAVAAALEPRLRSRPVAVATRGAARRVVLDASSVAHEAGVRRGMVLELACRRCRDLTVLEPTPRLYERAHDALFAEAAQLSPRVEPAGPGHLFVDLSGTERLFGDPVDSSVSLKRTIMDRLNLDTAVGVATNKLLSKVATRLIKPTGLCRVVAGCEGEFLAPLPVRILPGIDLHVIHAILQFNISNINELLHISEVQLRSVFGPLGSDIYRAARGIDDTPVRPALQPAPSVRESMVFEGHTNDDAEVERGLFALVTRAGMRLRAMGMAATSLCLFVCYSDGRAGRQREKLSTPLSGDLSLFSRCVDMLRRLFTRRVRMSDIALELSGLTYPYGEECYQMDLFGDADAARAREAGLMAALDAIRSSYGRTAVRFYGRECTSGR